MTESRCVKEQIAGRVKQCLTPAVLYPATWL